MKVKKECWICRRSQDELIKDLDDYISESGMPDDHVLLDVDIGCQKLFVCQGCNSIIFDLTHHNKEVDEYDIVLFDDLWNFQKKLKKVFEDE